jgi:hypothetical protein
LVLSKPGGKRNGRIRERIRPFAVTLPIPTREEAEQKRIMAAEGFAGVLDYCKRFDLHAIERLLAEQLQQRSAVLGVELNRFLINTYLAQGLASLVV